MNLEEDERFMDLVALFADSRINAGDARTSIKSSFMEKVFPCAFNRNDVPCKNSSIQSKLPTLAYWSLGKREKTDEAKG